MSENNYQYILEIIIQSCPHKTCIVSYNDLILINKYFTAANNIDNTIKL